ncbi:hypothetical protein R3Q06_33960 [Rhodococcus erythropolis]|uniref:hypothetical protein n=1 Tax=Rhodococcus erythropolis TaxID=1833 RepID=UPI00294A63D6|nr:hypothetical protein [Rhodococcus erythropolis]MDV6278432.1 hypothetical protein [Rhodococcus erythropolis]
MAFWIRKLLQSKQREAPARALGPGARVYVTNFLAATVSVISINSGCTSSLCSSGSFGS